MTRPSERRPPEEVPPTAGPSSSGANGTDLVTFFQPFYNLRSGRLQGVEALVRRHGASDGRHQLPVDFFAAASDEGSMRGIDLLVLEDALGYLARRRRTDGRTDLICSVNLSWEFVSHRDVSSDIEDALVRHGVPGDRLLIDITTHTFRRLVEVDGDCLERLNRLQRREVSFCLDGFTVEDLDLLPDAASVPVDIIKLHPSQVAVDTEDTRRQLGEIAQAIQAAGLPVVAAGVETADQLEFVRELGFEWAQGFLLGAPTAADDTLSHPASLQAD
ncbi:EAL domain-containing protein [Mobilicoccus caccae]|uniref:EAL domain-containing protein n=1 Tax=Mobilicoccus caccae TaxID=1859295 RepID=UPI0024E1166D|nr:EAL domain-containing protein [Mobilicoccus caccae]